MADSFKSILLVDDDLTLREMYSERLKAEGFSVEMAKDGEEALSMATELKPNIILLDIMMPKINGLDVLKKLKEQDETRSIPVIVLTALIQDREKMESITRGADDYIVKSEMMPGEVIEKVKNLLVTGSKTDKPKEQAATNPPA
ncbi:MAG: response regulator [Candidatus Berkelbacteria bacterium]|nr:MAG: response regulator [Candidatus Berkelbacteria bacterium]QQG51586.1 MAG: response regulator [Candidatus Berkelbacteria bacterium]